MAHSTGAVAVRAPSPPAASTQPLTAGRRWGGNHRTKVFRLAIRQAETPRPISARPKTSSPRPSLIANRAAPAAASSNSTLSTLWGLKRSSRMPRGN